MKRPDLLRLAYSFARSSPDPSTQNGAILCTEKYEPIYETGACNTFPTGVHQRPERLDRPLKYAVVEHAERNSLYAAARQGIATEGLTMVCPWAACSDCARAIIQCGISRLVTHRQAYNRSPPRWVDSIQIAFDMMEEAGIGVFFCEGYLDEPEILHNGVLWKP